MELLKPQAPLKYKHGDVTFLIKPKASSGDRLEIILSGSANSKGAIVVSRADYIRALIKRFVVGWEGVTLDGKEVAYSFELLDENFPKQDGDDVMLMLGDFIFRNTDIKSGESELKKESRRQPSGAHA